MTTRWHRCSGRTEEHGAHVGHACEQVHAPILEHDGGRVAADGENDQRRRGARTARPIGIYGLLSRRRYHLPSPSDLDFPVPLFHSWRRLRTGFLACASADAVGCGKGVEMDRYGYQCGYQCGFQRTHIVMILLQPQQDIHCCLMTGVVRFKRFTGESHLCRLVHVSHTCSYPQIYLPSHAHIISRHARTSTPRHAIRASDPA
jgi:hypothetical protein